MKISNFIYTAILPVWRHLPLGIRRLLIWIPTPKFIVGVGVVCMNNRNQVLLLQHRFHNEHPWGLPTGWIDHNENPQNAARREVKEETGIDIEITKIISVESNQSWLEIIFLCNPINDKVLLEGTEVQDYIWADCNDVHQYKLAPRQQKAIEAAIDSHALANYMTKR